MSTMDKIKYCLHIWVYNNSRFSLGERDYYMGLWENEKPHNIDNFFWRKVYQFYAKNITKIGSDHLSFLS